MTAHRRDAGEAVAGLFARTTATGGLASRELPTPTPVGGRHSEPRVRLGVELTDAQINQLRALSRPDRTGQFRTLGAKFVATGILIAALELLSESAIDMRGVTAGDLGEMAARARHALQHATGG